MKEELRSAGLTENESKLYITLLELGPSNAGLISRKSGLHRRVVYDTVEMLTKKGLVGYILQNNVRLYQAASPERVMEILKEKEEHVQGILPRMMEMYGKTKDKEETNFYKGKNGLKTVFEDQLEVGKDILVLGASEVAYDLLQFYFHWFDKRRVKSKIKVKVIFSEKSKNVKIPLSEIKYLPEKYSSPLAVNIYGDKVALILWSKERPMAIVIKNDLVSDGYKKYFDLMWKVAKK